MPQLTYILVCSPMCVRTWVEHCLDSKDGQGNGDKGIEVDIKAVGPLYTLRGWLAGQHPAGHQPEGRMCTSINSVT